MNTQISPVQIVLPIAVLAGLALALFFGINIAHENYGKLTFFIIGICIIAWAMIGRKIWWLPIFFFSVLSGTFYAGFKIYSHELAVLFCLLPLILTLAMKREHFKNRHFHVPQSVIILFIYISLHFMTCAIDNKVNGLGGLGSVTRRYMDALWPFLVFIPFLLVGNTKYIPWVLHLVGAAALIRFSLGMNMALKGQSETVLFIPIVNYVPPGGGHIGDLRNSGPILVSVVLSYFCIYRSFIIRAALVPLIAIGVWGTFLGGGRITIVLLFGLFGLIFLIYRRYGLLILWAVGMFSAMLLLNAMPEVLYQMPKSASRAASAFLFDRNAASDSGETAQSDEWHFRLMHEGYKSWTEDGMTILFGRGVKPFEERAWGDGKDLEGALEMAIATSRFESALWSALCTFGIVGLVLYAVLLFKIIASCAPILFREKIKTPVHAIMFIAVYQCITWFLLCWIAGSFPSAEILFGIVAMVAAHDMMRKRQADEEERTSQRVLSLPPDPGSLVGTPMK